MIPGKIGFTRAHVETWDRHWSPGTMGFLTPGRVLSATASGLCADFLNESLIAEVIDAVTPVVAPLKTIPASLVNTLVAPLKYFCLPHSLAMQAGSVTAGGVLATTGIIPYTANNHKARGLLQIALGDVNDASCVTLTNNGANWLTMNQYQAWEINFNLAYVANYDIAAASGAVQIGVGNTEAAIDPANPLATRFCCFRIAASRIHLQDESTASIASAPFAGMAGSVILTLRYDAARHAIDGFVNGVYLGTSLCNAAFVAAGIAARVYHLAAYAAAGDAPLALAIDDIVALNPMMTGG